MKQLLPGTVVEADLRDPDAVEKLIGPMFLTGGLVLSQVAQITGLEPYIIQNWVKRGFLAPPVAKKYTRRQLSRILLINMLKDSVQMERICQLLSCINNRLDDESDDVIDDSRLYGYLVRLIALAPERRAEELTDSELDQVMEGYEEPVEGAGTRIRDVLCVLLTLWQSAQLRHSAEQRMARLEA